MAGRKALPGAYVFVGLKHHEASRCSARLNPDMFPEAKGSIRSCSSPPDLRTPESLLQHEEQALKKHPPQNLERENDSCSSSNGKHRRVASSTPLPSTQPQDLTITTKPEQNFTVNTVTTPDRSQASERTQACVNHEFTTTTIIADIENQTANDPVAYWASHGHWPDNFANMSQLRRSLSITRLLNSSYTQLYRNGEVSRAHTRAYESELAESKVYMDGSKGKMLVSQNSKSLCHSLLQRHYPEPEHLRFLLPKFDAIWQHVQDHNDRSLFHDITPLLVPSPELLFFYGHKKLEHVAKALNVEWRSLGTLGGPHPKPDMIIGPKTSAFNEEELAKLQNHTSFERATLFAENIYFPFLIVEAKSGEDGINKADRQNLHSSSIATKAILELYRILGKNRAADFNGEILVFSISHNNERVKLCGHFAIVDEEGMSFYRYYFQTFTLNLDGFQGKEKTRDFVQAVYEIFYPAHLQRIRDALAEFQDPRIVMTRSNMIIDEADPQAIGRTPKKKTEWLVHSAERSEAWGLEARYQPMVWRLVAYHFLILSPSIYFMARWLLKMSLDHQDAIVTIMFQLGFLSLFWAIFIAFKTPMKANIS